MVGFLMIGIGVQGIYQARKQHMLRTTKKNKDYDKHDAQDDIELARLADSDVMHGMDDEGTVLSFMCSERGSGESGGMFQQLLSFVVGLVHGIAGPGAILGVLPAVEMQSVSAAALYLTSFITASTLSMGIFAAAYGEITKRLGTTAETVEYGLRLFSCSLSVVIGLLWMALSFLGTLDRFFH